MHQGAFDSTANNYGALMTDLSIPDQLNAVTQDLKQENDRKSVVTLIQDLAFVVEEAALYIEHARNCAYMQPPGYYVPACTCGHDRLEVQIEEVLQRAKEARRG